MRLNLRELSHELLKELCEDRTSESRWLEFKSQPPEKDERGKSEFLKDVVALANSEGGVILYGVNEDEGCASAIEPIPDREFDSLSRRLGQTLDSNVEPRISDIKFEAIACDSGFVLAVQVAPSMSSPHRINQGGKSRFVIREDAYIREMTYDEIKIAFGRESQIRSQIRAFRENRLNDLRIGRAPIRIEANTQCLVQLFPLSFYNFAHQFDLSEAEQRWSSFMLSHWGGASRTFNMDGLLVYANGKSQDSLLAYTQIFREGIIESAFAPESRFAEYRLIVPAQFLCENIDDVIAKGINEYREQRISGAVVILVSLVGVKGKKLGLGDSSHELRSTSADRNNLILPDVLIGEMHDASRVENAKRYLYDIIWQSFGKPACSFYDNDGKRIR